MTPRDRAIETPASNRVAATTDALRARIASGEWTVGSRIPVERELAQTLGVGRSTVREAVRALTALGMLEPLPARGTFVRAATAERGGALAALAEYSDEELMGLRRAIDIEAVQSSATRWDPADPERLGYLLYAEEDRLRAGGHSDPLGTHCTRFHAAIVRSTGNRLLVDLDTSLSYAMRSRGMDVKIAEALDVAICLNEHDRILTAVRDQNIGAATHWMALHLDAMLRGFLLEPVVTDLTALMGAAGGRPRKARGAA